MRHSLFIKLEHIKTFIMAGSEQGSFFIHSQNPIPCFLFLLSNYLSLGLNIPNPQTLIFRVCNQILRNLIKKQARDIILMTQNSGVFPSNLISILPQLYLPIIGTRRNNIGSRMKTNPITSFLMPLQNLYTLDLNPNKS